MIKLRLCTYLKVLITYSAARDSGQYKIVQALIDCACNKHEPIKDYQSSRWTNGEGNIPPYIIDLIKKNAVLDTEAYYNRFLERVIELLDEDRISIIARVLAYIILNDEDITDSCVVDSVSNTQKNDLIHTELSERFISGVFLFAVFHEKNHKCRDFADEIDNSFCEEANSFFLDLIRKASLNTVNPIIISEANDFCIKYEKDIELLPLCQVANIMAHSHEHVNPMYTDYCRYTPEVQSQIMQLKNIPIIRPWDDSFIYKLLTKFERDVEIKGLASRDKIYCISQYIDKSVYYADLIPRDTNPECFPCLPSKIFPNHTKTRLTWYIDDFLNAPDGTLPIPLDWMWDNFDFYNCDVRYLVFWLNLFVIHTCYSLLPKEVNLDKNPYLYMSLNIEYNLTTIEDMYYLSILRLYEIYYNTKGE